MSWNAIDAVMRRAVRRGLVRREAQPPRAISVDDTAVKRGHAYVTIVSDPDRGVVVHVADERKTQSMAGYYESLPESHKLRLEAVAMDMWPAYIAATEAHIPGAREKIAFDKFHVAKYLGEAVDRVRRQEHRALLGAGQTTLKGSK
ncbi:MAG: transposase, partial [Acidihalobacter sp.]